MKMDEIKELIALLESSGLEEIEIEENGRRIRVKKPSPKSTLPTNANFSIHSTDQRGNVQAAGHLLKSPFVGTFYRQPAPDAEPFVEKNDRVKKGDILCMVEAMKLMNEIESDINGRIIDILVENSDPVEFGQPLFVIEPD